VPKRNLTGYPVTQGQKSRGTNPPINYVPEPEPEEVEQDIPLFELEGKRSKPRMRLRL